MLYQERAQFPVYNDRDSRCMEKDNEDLLVHRKIL